MRLYVLIGKIGLHSWSVGLVSLGLTQYSAAVHRFGRLCGTITSSLSAPKVRLSFYVCPTTYASFGLTLKDDTLNNHAGESFESVQFGRRESAENNRVDEFRSSSLVHLPFPHRMVSARRTTYIDRNDLRVLPPESPSAVLPTPQCSQRHVD